MTLLDFKIAPAMTDGECGNCGRFIAYDDAALQCDDCLIDYDFFDGQARYIKRHAHACLTPSKKGISESTRVGWCYLPEDHTSGHYFLKKHDVE